MVIQTVQQYLRREVSGTLRTVVINAGSLVSSTALTAFLGAVFWWLAARHFSLDAVGLSSAAVSSMSLLAMISTMGLGTLLMGELRREQHDGATLISTALIATGTAGSVLGLGYAVIVPAFSRQLHPIGATVIDIVLFALGVSVMAISLVLDNALIGLLWGSWQLVRNAVFGLGKLALLLVVALALRRESGMSIYATWVVGNSVSILVIAVAVLLPRLGRRLFHPEWRLVRSLGRTAMSHHMLNLSIQAPSLILPILVASLISVHENAAFYIAWMMAYFIFVVPSALTTVLYSVSSAEPEAVSGPLRTTFSISVVLGVLGAGFMMVTGKFLLSLFGNGYTGNTVWVIRILVLAVFPLTIKNHFVALRRVRRLIIRSLPLLIAGGLLEIILAAIGALSFGIYGLSICWLLAVCVEGAWVAREVYRVAAPDGFSLRALSARLVFYRDR